MVRSRNAAIIGLIIASAIFRWANAQDRVGPSFDCGKATHPLALTLCADTDLSRVDLMYVQAYQALR
jgi:uncharacterized protein